MAARPKATDWRLVWPELESTSLLAGVAANQQMKGGAEVLVCLHDLGIFGQAGPPDPLEWLEPEASCFCNHSLNECGGENNHACNKFQTRMFHLKDV